MTISIKSYLDKFTLTSALLHEYSLDNPLYDVDTCVLRLLRSVSAIEVIYPKSNHIKQHEYDTELYEARHLIENFFAKLTR